MKLILIYTCTLSILFFASCKKGNDGQSVIQDGGLKAVVVNLESSTTSTTTQTISRETTNKGLITLLDITSYNAETGELILKNGQDAADKIGNLRAIVNVSFDRDHLFSLIYTNGVLNNLYNEPVLYYSLDGQDNTEAGKWYIKNGYPWGIIVNDKETHDYAQTIENETERRTNFEKIEAGWNGFIAELKKEDKYIE